MPVYTNTFVTVDGMNINKGQAEDLKKWIKDKYRYKPSNIRIGMSILIEGVENAADGFDLEWNIKKQLKKMTAHENGETELTEEDVEAMISVAVKGIE